MKAVVTGGAGFIGSHLVERLAEEGHETLALDNFASGRSRIGFIEKSGARFEEVDVRTESASELLESFRPEVVFHLAAQMSVRHSVENPVHDADVNILGMLRVLEATMRVGGRFVNTSSGGAMYGNLSDDMDRFTEDHVGLPTSPYGISKKIADNYLRFYESAHRLAFVNIAPSNVYGPRQDPTGEAGVVAIWGKRLLVGEACPIFGDGKQTRDFVYVSDVVDSFILAMTKGDGETFNVGTGVPTSVEDLYWAMAKICEVTRSPKYEPARPGDAYRMALDVSKAERVLGWKANVPLADGLRATIDSFR